MKWYVIRVANNKEKKTKESIEHELKINSYEHLVSELLVPLKKIEQKRSGKKINVEKITFPGYVFVKCENIDTVEGAIKHVPGVYSILKSPLSQIEIDRLQEKVIEKSSNDNETYSIGESIKITDGPFNNFIGTINMVDNIKQKCKLVVYVFGREVPLSLSFNQFIRNVE